MSSTAQFDGLFIATPERVSFSYQLAGVGSRFVAQLVDVIILWLVVIVLFAGVAASGMDGTTATLVVVIAWFVLVNGYFIFFEGLWSGQTPGKRLLRLRAVADAGQPITFEQSMVRNLVRNLDWLPFLYGVGFIALFANGRGKRLGDLAAGTVVVRERASLSLGRLVALSQWALEGARADPQRAAQAAAAEASYQRQRALRDLDPALRNFVIAYAGRRRGLAPAMRASFAETARTGLAAALPSVVADHGPLAALEQLADYAAGPEVAPPGAFAPPPPPPSGLPPAQSG